MVGGSNLGPRATVWDDWGYWYHKTWYFVNDWHALQMLLWRRITWVDRSESVLKDVDGWVLDKGVGGCIFDKGVDVLPL